MRGHIPFRISFITVIASVGSLQFSEYRVPKGCLPSDFNVLHIRLKYWYFCKRIIVFTRWLIMFYSMTCTTIISINLQDSVSKFRGILSNSWNNIVFVDSRFRDLTCKDNGSVDFCPLFSAWLHSLRNFDIVTLLYLRRLYFCVSNLQLW